MSTKDVLGIQVLGRCNAEESVSISTQESNACYIQQYLHVNCIVILYSPQHTIGYPAHHVISLTVL